jgi:DNA-binding LacI/PurR family transcriptional regulator
VESAIAQLRLQPVAAARALVTRRTRTIGLIAPGRPDYGPTSIQMHFTIAARAARYSVDTVSSLDSDPASVRCVVQSLLRQRVDAIVLIVVDVAVLEIVRGWTSGSR